MRSGWFFGTDMWQRYLAEYAASRPECLREFKTSPLAGDHDFSDLTDADRVSTHETQELDLQTHKWSDVRKSYQSLIHRGQE